MHIVFDGRALEWTGIGRYTRNLLDQYKDLPSSHTFTVLLPPTLVETEKKNFPSDRFTLYPIESSYYTWREQVVFWRQLENIPGDVFHFPHFNVPVLFRRPFVATIHDATRFIFPSQKRSSALEQLAYEYVFAKTLQHARAIISVTHHTAQQIQHLPLPAPKRMDVIYEGVSSDFHSDISREDRQKARDFLYTDAQYLLYVGVWMAHKNLIRLLQAFQRIRAKHPELELVITGKPVVGHTDIRPFVEQLGMKDYVRFVGFVPHNLLPAVYAESKGFVFPSLYEGFGLPPLEAAASGVPVVASQVSSMPEVLGDAAEYVNPESIESITKGIERILSDAGRRRELQQLGITQAQKFQWKHCAEKHLQIYEEIV